MTVEIRILSGDPEDHGFTIAEWFRRTPKDDSWEWVRRWLAWGEPGGFRQTGWHYADLVYVRNWHIGRLHLIEAKLCRYIKGSRPRHVPGIYRHEVYLSPREVR